VRIAEFATSLAKTNTDAAVWAGVGSAQARNVQFGGLSAAAGCASCGSDLTIGGRAGVASSYARSRANAQTELESGVCAVSDQRCKRTGIQTKGTREGWIDRNVGTGTRLI